MNRLLSLLIVSASIVAVAPTASADTGTLSVHLGATRLEQADSGWRPTVHTQFAFDLVGPLKAGLWASVMASDLPLRHPAFGGGLVLSVRPEIPIVRLTPIVEASAGRMQLALDQNNRESAWVTSLTGGLGVAVSDAVTVEGRLTHSWLHQLPSGSSLEPRTWTLTAGLSFDIP